MGHRKLFPKSGNKYLSPSEVITRLQAHFEHVEINQHQGATHVDKMVDQLTRMRFLSPPPATPEDIERLRSYRSQAVFVKFCDEPDSEHAYLTTTVIPGEPLFFGFSSSDQEEAAAKLLERCALILGYEIIEG